MVQTIDNLYWYRVEEVIKIYDGDTIRANVDLGFGVTLKGIDGGGQSFRLKDINAPEVRGEEREQGLVSRDALRDLMSKAEEIRIKSYVNHLKDKYGRYVAIFYIKVDSEWINVNEYMVENGYAEEKKY